MVFERHLHYANIVGARFVAMITGAFSTRGLAWGADGGLRCAVDELGSLSWGVVIQKCLSQNPFEELSGGVAG